MVLVRKFLKYARIWAPRKLSETCCNKSVTHNKLLVDPNCKYEIPLCKKINVNHNVRVFTFKLPEEDMVLGHGCGQNCTLHAKIGNESVSRSYTPTSLCCTQGYVEFMIKIYFKNVHPKFPQGGKMTQHLECLKCEDTILISGPGGNVNYKGNGTFCLTPHKGPLTEVTVERLGLVAGGVGITPTIQLLRTVTVDPEDNLECSLIYASKSKQDILCMSELNGMIKILCGRLKVWYTIEECEQDWPYDFGIVTKEMMETHLFPPYGGTLNLISGPWPMLQAVAKHFEDLGYTKEMYSYY